MTVHDHVNHSLWHNDTSLLPHSMCLIWMEIELQIQQGSDHSIPSLAAFQWCPLKLCSVLSIDAFIRLEKESHSSPKIIHGISDDFTTWEMQLHYTHDKASNNPFCCCQWVSPKLQQQHQFELRHFVIFKKIDCILKGRGKRGGGDELVNLSL